MGAQEDLQYWEVWYPKAAATGMLVGRGMVDPTNVMLLHAAPELITVEVSDVQGSRLAQGENLTATAETPICCLTRRGEKITREDIWPTQADYGSLVLLPGGEVGTLISWWNAEDCQEWRWQIELYNSKR